jgi:hypothetical protein
MTAVPAGKDEMRRSCGRIARQLIACLLATSIVAPADSTAQDQFALLAQQPDSELYFRPWEWQLLPDGLLYRSYLAGPKEPRFAYAWLYDTYGRSWVNDATIGGRMGIIRLGTDDPILPTGWQLDTEGAAMPRLNGSHDLDLTSADYRIGIPITWRDGPFQTKVAWYHVSSHAGDEFLLSHPTFERINYRRDALVLGGGWFPTPSLRLYGELGYAFITDGGAEPWELQFGWEYAPNFPTGVGGAPFLAMNAYLRQEVDWGGDFTVMAGWAWRGRHLLRAGLQYTLSETTQWQFLGQSEQLIGLGLWYDF